jgi:hypothetical protein
MKKVNALKLGLFSALVASLVGCSDAAQTEGTATASDDLSEEAAVAMDCGVPRTAGENTLKACIGKSSGNVYGSGVLSSFGPRCAYVVVSIHRAGGAVIKSQRFGCAVNPKRISTAYHAFEAPYFTTAAAVDWRGVTLVGAQSPTLN